MFGLFKFAQNYFGQPFEDTTGVHIWRLPLATLQFTNETDGQSDNTPVDVFARRSTDILITIDTKE